MGQKVNPHGIRLGINKTWSSRWFSKSEYSKLLHQDLEIKRYVEQKLKNASISKVNIETLIFFSAARFRLNCIVLSVVPPPDLESRDELIFNIFICILKFTL